MNSLVQQFRADLAAGRKPVVTQQELEQLLVDTVQLLLDARPPAVKRQLSEAEARGTIVEVLSQFWS